MYIVDTPQTGNQTIVHLSDTNAGSKASIALANGFNCFSFVVPVDGSEHDFLYASPTFPSPADRPTRNGTPILCPFPNRIREGRFSFNGQTYELPRNEAGKNAIHGFAFDQPWRMVDQSTGHGASVTGEWQLSVDRPDYTQYWPADFRIRVTYQLTGNVLTTAIRVRNMDTRPLPFGLGTHPYFRFPQPGSDAADAIISCPAEHHVELIECLPTGTIRAVSQETDLRSGVPLAGRSFDDVYTTLTSAPDNAQMIRHSLRDQKAGVEFLIEHGQEFPFTVVFIPPHREAVCIEPYTCITDALNQTVLRTDQAAKIESGLWIIQPGDERIMTIRYEAKSIKPRG